MKWSAFHTGWFAKGFAAACLISAALFSAGGCGSGLTTAESGSGVIVGGVGTGGTGVIKASLPGATPDSCLVKAVVFADKNGNRQLDDGEPNATSDANCGYTLTLDPAEAGQYPLLVMAIAGVTLDKATNRPVSESYVVELR